MGWNLVRDQGVGGSNPLSPTILSYDLTRGRILLMDALCRRLWRNQLVWAQACRYESPERPVPCA